MRRQTAKRILAILLSLAALGGTFLVLTRLNPAVQPRLLNLGDSWNYQVTFPDSHGYVLTETIRDLVPNNTYLIFQDDDQHITTGYWWLNSSWFESQASKVRIGNMDAQILTIYNPPIRLIQIPLRVGNDWIVNSSLITKTTAGNETKVNASGFVEERKTVALEFVQTPAGYFQAYKIDVITSGSLYETLWFSKDLGLVVYAKFYNTIGESVTETLAGYRLVASVAATEPIPATLLLPLENSRKCYLLPKNALT